ncbi:MAG: DUF1223 domain-containing protein [Pseudomonadota bacterium]
MLRALIFIPLFCVVSSGLARAESFNLVELFVSQNCPACPAAQENLVELQETDGPFIPLIWVIDYWDYVDEPDPMAIPESSTRQRVYADSLGIRGPYTPQLIVNGVAHVAGNRKRRVRSLLAEQRDLLEGEESIATLDATSSSVSITGTEDAGPQELWVMALGPMQRYGLDMPNAVMKVTGPFSWAGGEMEIDYTCDHRCVAVLQGIDRGPVSAVLAFEGEPPT